LDALIDVYRAHRFWKLLIKLLIRMNKTRLATIIILLLTRTVFGQSELCFENSKGEYWPIKAGMKIQYSSGQESYTSYFNGDSLKVGSKYFLKEIKQYASGKTTTGYWREENGVVFFYDVEKNAESIELINNLIPGTTWEKYDKTWKYTVIDTLSTFSTPFCKFNNLLEIKAEPQNELKDKMEAQYHLFYKRGVGMVGMNVNGEPYLYAKPSKEVNERSFVAYGCENLASNAERRKCTFAKITEFFSSEYKAPKKKDFSKGRILLNVFVGTDGTIEDVTVLETIAGAKDQEKEAIRVVKKLPKMIPAQVDDGQPIRSSFKFPINF
jgi:TonB family protein